MIDFDYVKKPDFWNSVFEPFLIVWGNFAKSIEETMYLRYDGDIEGVLKDGEF